jgi:lysophospholipase L1-like esterase
MTEDSDKDPVPGGMVDHLPDEDVSPTAEELAFARAYVSEGDLTPTLIAALFDPDRVAERERISDSRRQRDWPALGRYRRDNAVLVGRSTDVVFIGDSITEMWGAAHPDLFAGSFVNRGISGQTSPQILLRFMADVVALKPRVVHLMCGVNDIAGNTGPTTPEDYRNNVVAMLDLAQAHGITVVLGSVTPITSLIWAPAIRNHREQVARLNRDLGDLARRRGLVQADYHSVLAAEDGAMRAAFTRDGVHPMTRGYDAMRPVAEAALSKALVRTG